MKNISGVKYNSIMNLGNFRGKMAKLPVEAVEEILALDCFVTEKLHGENFRFGFGDGKFFIGQKNNMWREIESHPHSGKFSEKLLSELATIAEFVEVSLETSGYSSLVFYGELIGKGVQKGFEWPFDGLEVRWFGIKGDDGYFPMIIAKSIFDDLGLKSVPVVSQHMSLKEAIALDVDNMVSEASTSPLIEGVVIVPNEIPEGLWRFADNLIIKHKSKKYSEGSKQRPKNKIQGDQSYYVSEFNGFVTPARIEHAIQAIQERNIPILWEMSDMRYLVNEVIQDITKEENDGQKLDGKDCKSISREIAKVYQEMLNEKIKEMLG